MSIKKHKFPDKKFGIKLNKKNGVKINANKFWIKDS
jgi:hypothetical protein